jgi:hypothetical protein
MFDNALESIRRYQLPVGPNDIAASLREAKDAGSDYVRTLAQRVRSQGDRAGRSITEMIQERPAESLLLVAGVAFAAGWFVRHMRRRAEASRTSPKSRARARK